MAGKKISQLTLLPTLDGTELLPLVKGGENYSGVTEAISKLLLSLDNKFTGDNSFVGGQFSVGGASGATEILVRLQLEGSTKGALGNSVTNGTFLYDYTTTSYLAIKADGAYYGKESSMEKIVTESTITTLTKQITNLEQRIATLEGAGS